MNISIDSLEDKLINALEEVKSSGDLTLEEKRKKLLSQIDVLLSTDEGFQTLASKIEELVNGGLFNNTVWASIDNLVPSLVAGTIRAGYPANVLEICSELRMVNIINTPSHPYQQKALQFMKQVVAQNLDLLFPGETEADRFALSDGERKKLLRLFSYIIEHIPAAEIKERLAEELKMLAAQRRVMVDHLRHVVELSHQKIPLESGYPADDTILYFLDALKHPSPLAKSNNTQEAYKDALMHCSDEGLAKECQEFGEHMFNTGIVCDLQLVLLDHVKNKNTDLLALCLNLDDHGKADLNKYLKFVLRLIEFAVIPDFPQSLLGLSLILKRNLLSRSVIRNSLTRLLNIKLDQSIEELLNKRPHPESTGIQILVAGTLSVLGQPLGVGQGMNPTCQSARGISMWSQHAPAKLVQRIISVASYNNLDMSYDSKSLQSANLFVQTSSEFDFNLDPVSIVLVPHLDRIYNEMSRLALFHHPTEDPHHSVNPAFYGSWIQTGFKSVYSQLLNGIVDYSIFIRSLYAAFHPEHNGGHPLVYPVPLGIFITSSAGDFLGFHAISLLRVAYTSKGECRAYFLNPNNEGRQDWGQGIRPTVYINEEKAGESSLPFEQLAARIYAYHYNSLMVDDKINDIPLSVVAPIEKLARESWGRKYIWIS